jgi:hypothetical protein
MTAQCTCDRDTIADNMASPGCPVHAPRQPPSQRTGRLPNPAEEPFAPCDEPEHWMIARAAEAMAAAIDILCHRGLIDARSLPADARLLLGDPWSEEEAVERLRQYRPGGGG